MIFVFDDFELNTQSLELRRSGVPVRADAIVLRVLSVLVESAGELVTKERLHEIVWSGRAVSENVITVAMARLRKTLGGGAAHPPHVITVHGRGYRFVRPVTAKSGRSTPPPGPGATPFVGREPAIARFRAVLGEARAGRGSVFVLLGDAGMGKTRLVEEMEPEARALGFAVAWGICREAGDTPPLWPFVQVIRELLQSAPPDARDPRMARALGEVSRLVPELAGSGGTPSFGGDEPLATYRLFDAVARVLALTSELRPCLVILEDLHRADSASLEVIRYFVDQIPRTRVALVATHRTGIPVEASVRGHLGYVLGHRNTSRFALEPLVEAQVCACVASALSDPSGGIGRAVFEKCEGNPFLMTELLRALLDGSAGEKAGDGAALTLPDAALEHMRQRVAAVNERGRGILTAAAVLGRHFDFPTLEALTGLTAGEVMCGLDVAVESGVVRPSAQSKTSFVFAHDLLRAVLYDRLPLAERRDLHLRVVAALSQRRTSGTLVPEAELAYHAYAALPAGDPRRAVQLCVEAASAAARRRAYADGVRALGQALEALALVPDASPRFRLSLLLSRSLQARVCHSPAFGDIAGDAARLARELGAMGKLGRVGLLLDVHPGLPALPGARGILQEALERLPGDDDETRACLLGRLANSAPIAFDSERTRASLMDATALAARSGTPLARHTVLTARLYAEGGPAHDAELVHVVRELEDICAANPDAMSVIPVLIELQRAVRAAQRGARDEADAVLERSVARCRALGHVELLWHTERFRLLLARPEMNVADFENALALLHRRAEREAIPSASLLVAYDVSVILRSLAGAEMEALAALPARVPEEPPGLWAVRVRTLTAAGRRDDALALLRFVPVERLASLPVDRDHVGTLGTLLRAAAELGAHEHASVLAGLLEPYDGLDAVNAAFHSEGAVRSLLRGAPRSAPLPSPPPSLGVPVE